MAKKIIFIYFFLYISLAMGNGPLHNKLKKTEGKDRFNVILELTDSDEVCSGIESIEFGKAMLLNASINSNKHIKVRGLQTLARGYNSIEKPALSLSLWFNSLKIATKYNYLKEIAKSYSELGNIFYFIYGDYSRAIKYYQKSLAIFEKMNDLYGQCKIRNNVAEVYLKIGKYAEAVELYTKSLSGLESLGDLHISAQITVVKNLASVTLQLGNTDIALRYIKRFKVLYYKFPTEKTQQKLYSLQSQYYFKIKNYKEALQFVNLAYFTQLSIAKTQSLMAGNRVLMSLLSTKIEILLKMNNLTEAFKNIYQLEEMLKQSYDPYTQVRLLISKAKYIFLKGDIEKAIQIGEENEKICKINHFYRELDMIYTDLSHWNSKVNNKEKSINFFNKKMEIMDMSIGMELPANVMAIVLRYEENKLSKRIHWWKKMSFKITISTFVILILSIFTFLFFQRKSKKKANLTIVNIEKKHSDQLTDLQNQLLKYQNKSQTKVLDSNNAEIIMSRILKLIEKDKLYLDETITLDKLSKLLSVNKHYLSTAINKCWNKNFKDLINSYRVKEARRLLSDSNYSKLNIIEIGYRSGFNSKTSFNRIFKEKTQMTPLEYQKKLGQNIDNEG